MEQRGDPLGATLAWSTDASLAPAPVARPRADAGTATGAVSDEAHDELMNRLLDHVSALSELVAHTLTVCERNAASLDRLETASSGANPEGRRSDLGLLRQKLQRVVGTSHP